MPVFGVIFWAAVAISGVVLVAWQTINATAPKPLDHAAMIESCNGPTEIAAIVGADATAAAAMKTVGPSSATVATAAGNLTASARSVNGEYVFTIGSGSDARTCHIPIAKRSL